MTSFFVKPRQEVSALMRAVAALIVVSFLAPFAIAGSDFKAAALGSAAWIRANSLRTTDGKTWPIDPHDPKNISSDLYSGTSGVVLFFLEVYQVTGHKAYLKEAMSGADYLIESLPEEKGTGLYEGLAGIGFVLHETFKASGQEKYREGARQCVRLIKDRASKIGKGVEWNTVTDIISGGSGTGLFLLYSARELHDRTALELATEAGSRLVELGMKSNGGLKWAMSSKSDRFMPNFSHGTAGVAYFLAILYRETKRKEFLDASLAGAAYLRSVAQIRDDSSLIFHHEPGGEDLFYLGWCHGPVGTARLYYQLYRQTGDKTWMDSVYKSANAILNSGIPEKRTPGFWNNVGICCGSAGVAKFFLDLYRVTKKPEYLAFAKRLTVDLLSRSTVEGKGLKWIQAEHRTKPELLIAQTGYMQGAAGIGSWLLDLDSFGSSRHKRIRFPDSPF